MHSELLIVQNAHYAQNAQWLIHDVYLTRRAQKEIDKLGHEAQDRVLDAIDDLKGDPTPHGDRMLLGDRLDCFHIRVGNYLIISPSKRRRKTYWSFALRHRRDAYRVYTGLLLNRPLQDQLLNNPPG